MLQVLINQYFFYMINITGSQEVKIKSVMFKTGYASSSGGYGFSVKLEPNPPNGKSCQVVFGDMGPNKALTKNAPASCEDLQLTTTSQIRVSKHSTLVCHKNTCLFLKVMWILDRIGYFGPETAPQKPG